MKPDNAIVSDSRVYLIPVQLAEGVTETIPAYVLDAVKKCEVFFVENIRSARRFLKSIWKEMVIDDYEFIAIHKAENEVISNFSNCIKNNKIIGILSEAGCPGIADPGQILIAKAQALGVKVVPLVGPSSILLSLMASGLNGQSFRFHGYLPIDSNARKRALSAMETDIVKSSEAQIFIETPYRNNQLIADILVSVKDHIKLCIAANITDASESIITRTVGEWKKREYNYHKQTVIMLLGN